MYAERYSGSVIYIVESWTWVKMVKLILCTKSGVKVNRDVGDIEDGFVCFACREREEMKGEIGRLRQVVCELVDTISGGVGRVHSQREVVNCSTQTEAGIVTVVYDLPDRAGSHRW